MKTNKEHERKREAFDEACEALIEKTPKALFKKIKRLNAEIEIRRKLREQLITKELQRRNISYYLFNREYSSFWLEERNK